MICIIDWISAEPEASRGCNRFEEQLRQRENQVADIMAQLVDQQDFAQKLKTESAAPRSCTFTVNSLVRHGSCGRFVTLLPQIIFSCLDRDMQRGNDNSCEMIRLRFLFGSSRCFFSRRREGGQRVVGYPSFGRSFLGSIEADFATTGLFCSICQTLECWHALAPLQAEQMQFVAAFIS